MIKTFKVTRNTKQVTRGRKLVTGYLSRVTQKNGFTLIELIMVIALMAILSTAGFSAFIKYREQQAFNTAVSDVVNTLYSLRSRSQSRVAFNRADRIACDKENDRDATAFVLKSWELDPCKINGKPTDGAFGNPKANGCPDFSMDYFISATCQGQDGSNAGDDETSIVLKKFSTPDIKFIAPTTNWIGFLVPPGGGIERGDWDSGNKLVISGYGFQRTITVNDDQSITVTNP